MEFKDNEAIYLQIAAFVSENILLGKWPPGEKIPSVRDMAVELEVNPNTVMRSYEFLQQQEVIVIKRGLGLFVAPDGLEKVQASRKQHFLQQELPALFRNMYLLGISLVDIQQQYEAFNSNHQSTSANNHEKE